MGLFENFPYTNFHRVNMDWILQIVKSLEPVPAELEELKNYIEENFPEAVQEAFDKAVQDGTLSDILKEELVFVTPQMYGAKGDGVNDDTEAIQAAIDSGKPVVFPAASYLVHATNDHDSAISARSGSYMIFQDALIVLAATAAAAYQIINIGDVSDVVLTGRCTLRGDRLIHIGSSGEHGMGLNIWQSSRVSVDGIQVENCWGDGIYINKSSDITVRECQAINNRRNNISIIAGENLLLERCNVKNANGTNPQAGIGVEANNATDPLTNCVIRDCTSSGNTGASLYITCRADDSNVRVEGGSYDSRPGSTFLSGSGVIEYNGCRIECGTAEIFSVDNVPLGSFVKFTNCELYGGSSIIRHAGGSGSVLHGLIVKDCISYNANLSRLGTWLTYGNGTVSGNVLELLMVNPTVTGFTSNVFLDPENTCCIKTAVPMKAASRMDYIISTNIWVYPAAANDLVIRNINDNTFQENTEVLITNMGTNRGYVDSTSGSNFYWSDSSNVRSFPLDPGQTVAVLRLGGRLRIRMV